jgi:general stress protein 26
MSRREEIRMTDGEVAGLLESQLTVICSTVGLDGWPHTVPLWYVVRDGELWTWTYAASQKVRNLERDPRATLLVESGEAYDELRGVMLRAEAEIERSPQLVSALGMAVLERSAGGRELTGEAAAAVLKQAPKRVAIRFVERARISWDHRKLAARGGR